VVQLQFLDRMIQKECGAVPVDAATRADLIDLMARVLAVVFHEEGGSVNDRRFVQCQIKPEHLARKAIVYLRQLAKDKYDRIRKVNSCGLRWPNGCVLWAGSRSRS
jgi:hypothetical protein